MDNPVPEPNKARSEAVGSLRRSGSEPFHNAGTTAGFDLLAFWQWCTSDVLSNATRGRIAEFIVARALGLGAESIRDEWAAYDLETDFGIKIEVKSAAYVQSWHQVRPSVISFRTPKTRAWDPLTNVMESESRRQADVYVFALLAHEDKPTIDPLDLSQWRFYVLPTRILDERTRSQHSITLNTLERLAGGSVGYTQLRSAIEEAASLTGDRSHG